MPSTYSPTKPHNMIRSFENLARSFAEPTSERAKKTTLASANAVGHYLAFLDNMADVFASDKPKLTEDGGIRVDLHSPDRPGAFIIFTHSGQMTLGTVIAGQEKSRTQDWNLNSLLDFAYAARS